MSRRSTVQLYSIPFVLAFTLLILFNSCVSGKTIVVDRYGNGDFTSISDALENAIDGDIIFVKSGTYQENIVLNKNVSIKGEDKKTSIIEAAVEGHTLRLYKINNCTISKLTIRGAKGTGNDNIYLDECENIVITDCNIEGSAESDGISLYRSNNITITNCLISNNNGNGIIFMFSCNCFITNNNMSGNQIGITLQYRSNNNTISRNKIEKNEYMGIRILASGMASYSPSDNMIFENTFRINGENAEDTTDNLNLWYNPDTKRGNYWDDYTGIDNNGDGIGDVPYYIPGGNNVDSYVLGFFEGSSGSQSNQKPFANADGPYYAQIDVSIQFDADKSYDPDGRIVQYVWDFGDGTTGEGKIVYHSYSQPGNYTVTLTVVDDDGARDTDTTFALIYTQIENKKPVPVIDSKDYATVGEILKFNASESYDPDGTIIKYIWKFGDGKVDYGITTFHSYSQPGVYTVTLEVVDDEGFKNTTSKNITIYSQGTSPLVAHMVVQPSTAYVNAIVYFNASASEGEIVRYIWDFGDGSNETTYTPFCNHTYSKPGIYYVNLTVVGVNGEISSTSEVVVIKEIWKKTPGYISSLVIVSFIIALALRRRGLHE